LALRTADIHRCGRRDDKVDYYNLPMPSYCLAGARGFGIVLLEAMACGLPALASILDGSREHCSDGELGVLVDPRDSKDLKRGIREILNRPKKVQRDLSISHLIAIKSGCSKFLPGLQTVHMVSVRTLAALSRHRLLKRVHGSHLDKLALRWVRWLVCGY